MANERIDLEVSSFPCLPFQGRVPGEETIAIHGGGSLLDLSSLHHGHLRGMLPVISIAPPLHPVRVDRIAIFLDLTRILSVAFVIALLGYILGSYLDVKMHDVQAKIIFS